MAREREVDLAERMSEHEALMWNIEKDPWLNPNGAALTILDAPLDVDILRQQLRYGVAKMPRLYQRVVPGLGRVSTPGWVPDIEFDFDYHFRETHLPEPGTERQLMDLATRLYEEPLDRTRPLWRIIAISGLEGGRSAIYSLIHHAVSDGIGQLRIAELYQQATRDEPPRPDVDLDAIVAEAHAEFKAKEQGGDLASSLRDTATKSISHVIRRQAGLARTVAAELVLWPADPDRAKETAEDALDRARGIFGQVSGLRDSDGTSGGSPLLSERSRHRHLEYVHVDVEALKAAAKALGGSINDAFLVGMTEGAYRYHADRDISVDGFNTSFVLSTRKDNKMGGNSFTPVLIRVAGGNLSFQSRMENVQQVIADAREKVESGGGIGGLSAVINLLPTSVVTRVAKEQAAKIDFATSNLRGASFPLYCAGARVERVVCMGPVAATAANITALSSDGNFDIGIFVDPAAVTDPEAYRDAIQGAFDDLISETIGSTSNGKSAGKTTSSKTTSSKTASSKTASSKGSGKRKAVAAKSVSKKPKKKASSS